MFEWIECWNGELNSQESSRFLYFEVLARETQSMASRLQKFTAIVAFRFYRSRAILVLPYEWSSLAQAEQWGGNC
jgi:hypothetical protein